MITKPILILGLIALLALPVHAATLRTPWSQPADFPTWQEDGITYTRATDFFTLLDGTVDLGPFPADAQIGLRGHTVLLYYNSPFVQYDGRAYNLVYPVLLKDGAPALPVATTAELASLILGMQFQWDPGTQTLQFIKTTGEIEAIRAEMKRNGMLINILTGGPVTYEVYTATDNWLNITIPGAKLGKIGFNRRPFSRYIWEFKPYQFEESVQLSFRLRPGRLRYEHRFVTNPYRIEIALIDTTFEFDSTDTPGLFHTDTTGGLEETEAGVETDPIDVIVVDAGHGGRDWGATGPRGTKEKDVVLGVALELARLLRADPDFKVILTRDRDVFIPLQDRAKIANDANADLFVSIHANSAPKRSARGFETFFLAAAKSDEARATAQLENASLRFEDEDQSRNGSDIDFILTDLLQNQFLVESAALAQTIQTRLGDILNTPDRGVNQAGFVVLYYAYMPSVLVETGFISNRDEERWLAAESSQKKIARAIYQSIVEFRDTHEVKP